MTANVFTLFTTDKLATTRRSKTGDCFNVIQSPLVGDHSENEADLAFGARTKRSRPRD